MLKMKIEKKEVLDNLKHIYKNAEIDLKNKTIAFKLNNFSDEKIIMTEILNICRDFDCETTIIGD